jgi:hypothetical protein
LLCSAVCCCQAYQALDAALKALPKDVMYMDGKGRSHSSIRSYAKERAILDGHKEKLRHEAKEEYCVRHVCAQLLAEASVQALGGKQAA